MQQLILIRGLPGSGKSTLAKGLVGFEHYEADMFFMKEEKYLFDTNKIKDAHAWCKQQTLKSLTQGKSVVVSNTFTRRWEMQAYIEMAKAFGIEPTVLITKGDYENIHSVPDELIENMKARWED